MILNMLSTASMVGIGKTYQNLLVDLQPTNKKLVERAKRIVMEATSCEFSTAEKYLEKTNHEPKVAIVILLVGLLYNYTVYHMTYSNIFFNINTNMLITHL